MDEICQYIVERNIFSLQPTVLSYTGNLATEVHFLSQKFLVVFLFSLESSY